MKLTVKFATQKTILVNQQNYSGGRQDRMGLTHFPNPIRSRDHTLFFIEKALNLALNHYKLSLKPFRFYQLKKNKTAQYFTVQVHSETLSSPLLFLFSFFVFFSYFYFFFQFFLSSSFSFFFLFFLFLFCFYFFPIFFCFSVFIFYFFLFLFFWFSIAFMGFFLLFSLCIFLLMNLFCLIQFVNVNFFIQLSNFHNTDPGFDGLT